MDAEGAAERPHLEPVRRGVGGADLVQFARLYEGHHIDVLRYALVLVRNREEAEDVAAETFARAWRAWAGGSRPPGQDVAWLLAIARNIATDRWRRIRRRASRPAGRSAQDTFADAEQRLWLDALARTLPPRQREVIALRYHRDLSDADIGKVMGLSESGVRSLVARAISTLRQHPEVWQ